MPDTLPSISATSLPFQEQIDFFRQKVKLGTRSWTKIWNEEHDRSFVVAGAMRDDMLADFRSAVDKAISEGATLEAFRKDFDRIVNQYGWSYNGGRNWRSKVIYSTNLRTSYMAGQYAQLQASKEISPYWMYKHSELVQHPRPEHQAWDGLVLHADDPWWNTHFPPNGWGCMCRIVPMTKGALKRSGRTGPDTAPPLDMQTVTVGVKGPTPRTVQVPKGIDPGFGYAPGKAAWERKNPTQAEANRQAQKELIARQELRALQANVQAALGSAARLPAAVGAQSTAEMLANPRAAAALQSAFADFVADTARSGVAKGNAQIIGAITPELVAAMEAHGVSPDMAQIVVQDDRVWHALRDAKASATTAGGEPKGLTVAELQLLPALIAAPRAVLLDVESGTLFYVADADRREAMKIVVRVNFPTKVSLVGEKRTRQTINSFRTASLLDLVSITKDIRAGVLVLIAGTL